MKTKFSLEDLIQKESRELALSILSKRLTEVDLPLPKDSQLEIHLEALQKMNPQIETLARERVLAQQDAYSQSLRAIGLPVPDLPIPLDIDLDL